MIFISYSSKDAADAYMIQSVLNKNGIETWMAPDSIPAGSNYTSEIPKAIRACAVFLLVLSENAQKSVWVSAEVENAYKNEKVIVPFVIENCPLHDDFDFLLSRSQRISAFEKKTEALQNLVVRLKAMPGVNVKGGTGNTGTSQFGSSFNAGNTSDMVKTFVLPANSEKKTESNGNVYEGVFVNGKLHGKGRLTWKSGTKYEGDFVNGARTGKGKITWESGTTFEGDFINGTRTGKGKIVWTDGTVYEGDFANEKMQGHGKLTWKSGAYYEGEFADDKKNGHGRYVSANGTVYEGEFRNGKYNGTGKMTWTDGGVYEGNFIDDIISGRGKMTWADRTFFVGEFKDGNPYDGTTYDQYGIISSRTVKGKVVRGTGE